MGSPSKCPVGYRKSLKAGQESHKKNDYLGEVLSFGGTEDLLGALPALPLWDGKPVRLMTSWLRTRKFQTDQLGLHPWGGCHHNQIRDYVLVWGPGLSPSNSFRAYCCFLTISWSAKTKRRKAK